MKKILGFNRIDIVRGGVMMNIVKHCKRAEGWRNEYIQLDITTKPPCVLHDTEEKSIVSSWNIEYDPHKRTWFLWRYNSFAKDNRNIEYFRSKNGNIVGYRMYSSAENRIKKLEGIK